MLSILKKHICPLMSLALAFGCGKKINDPKTTPTNNNCSTCQTTELPSVLTLKIDEAVSSATTYKLTRNAWFNLPATLQVIEGSAIGKRVKIYYNMINSVDYEFSCSYKSVSAPKTLAFEKCESQDGVQIISNSTDLVNMDFPMDDKTSIKLQLVNGSQTGIKIESTYQVDWK